MRVYMVFVLLIAGAGCATDGGGSEAALDSGHDSGGEPCDQLPLIAEDDPRNSLAAFERLNRAALAWPGFEACSVSQLDEWFVTAGPDRELVALFACSESGGARLARFPIVDGALQEPEVMSENAFGPIAADHTASHPRLTWVEPESGGRAVYSEDAAGRSRLDLWPYEMIDTAGRLVLTDPNPAGEVAYVFAQGVRGPMQVSDADQILEGWGSATSGGDVDGDGLEDVLLAGYSAAVLPGAANESEQPEPVPFSDQQRPQGAADQNGDGYGDLFLVRTNADLEVRLGPDYSLYATVLHAPSNSLSVAPGASPAPVVFDVGSDVYYALTIPSCGTFVLGGLESSDYATTMVVPGSYYLSSSTDGPDSLFLISRDETGQRLDGYVLGAW